MALFNQDVDVIAFHTGSDAVMVAAQERGKMAVAYHSDMRKAGPDAQIAAVTHHWGDYYKARTQAVLDGSWKSGKVWGGVKEGMIRVGDFGPKVPKAVQAEVQARQKDIAGRQAAALRRPDQRQRGQARFAPRPGNDGRADTGYELSRIRRAGEDSKIVTCHHASLSRRHPEIRRRPFRCLRGGRPAGRGT